MAEHYEDGHIHPQYSHHSHHGQQRELISPPPEQVTDLNKHTLTHPNLLTRDLSVLHLCTHTHTQTILNHEQSLLINPFLCGQSLLIDTFTPTIPVKTALNSML